MMMFITYQCRVCRQTIAASKQEVNEAWAERRFFISIGAEEDVSQTDAEVFDEYGRDICPECSAARTGRRK